ncbi:MAG TPA: caspase family protein [Bacteroidia bacterium]
MKDFAKYGLIIITFLFLKPCSAQKISFELQTGHTSAIKTLYLSPDNELLFSSASRENAVYVWQSSTGKKIKTIYSTKSFAETIGSFMDSVSSASPEIKTKTKEQLKDSNIVAGFTLKSTIQAGDTLFTQYGLGVIRSVKQPNGLNKDKQLFDQATMKKYTGILLLDRSKKQFLVSTDRGDIVTANYNGNKVKAYKLGRSAVSAMYLSNDKQFLVVGNELGEIYIIDLKSGELKSQFKGPNKPTERIYYSADGTILYMIRGSEIISYNYTNNVSKRLNTKEKMENVSIDSASGDSVVMLTYLNSQSKVSGRWNMLKNTFSTKEVAYAGTNGSFSTYIASIQQTADSFDGIEVFNPNTGGTVFSIKQKNEDARIIETGNASPITAIRINKAFRYVSVAHLDGKIAHYDLNTGKALFTSIILNTNTYIHLLPNGYYFGTKQIFNALNCVKGSRILPNFQMDAEYNRPDQVIKIIPQHDPILAAAIEHSYEKRERKTAANSDNLESDITLQATQEEILNGKLGLNIRVKSSLSTIKDIRLFLNGVDEKIIVPQNKNEVELKYTIELANGENKIELFASDNSGGFSDKISFTKKNKTNNKANLYLICIGSAKFQQSDKNLNYADKDAKDVFNMLSGSKMYQNVYKVLYLNDQVTASITGEIEKLLSGASKNDVVMLFYAGHGILNKDLDYYLSSYDVDFNQPEQKGIPYEKIQGVLENCKARQKLFFIDACHSGDIEKKDAKQIVTNSSNTSSGITFRSGTTSLSQNELSLMFSKELFASGSNSSGTSIIGASMGSQYALESNQWNNGVFTHCLLQAIAKRKADYNKDNKVMLDELQYYVNKSVEELTNGKQKPTTRTENLIGNIRIR